MRIVDNVPVRYAVLQADPPLDHGQWLLVTRTCGFGGGLLSVGSAAGAALMGASAGRYTFASRWSWAVAAGYALGVAVHLWWNQDLFTDGIRR